MSFPLWSVFYDSNVFFREALLADSAERRKVDGLNSLKYNLKEVIEYPLATIVQVEIKETMYNISGRK